MWFFILSGLIACAGKLVSSNCPIQMSVPGVVVRYGDSFSVNCSSLLNQSEGMGWESSYGGTGLIAKPLVTLEVKLIKHWEMSPKCFINPLDRDQCLKSLPVTVYKTPDSVSISHRTQTGPMVEGGKYHLHCDIVNVAPARNLSVNWYKGNTIIYTETFSDSTLSQVSKSSVLNLTAHRDENGTLIWCEAKLNFSPPVQNLTANQSKPLELIVLYPPTFTEPANETLELRARSKLILNCTVKGNPVPVYSWNFPHAVQQTNNQNENQSSLTPDFQLPGTYACTASNTQGSMVKYFNVVEPPRNRTVFAALVGGFVSLGVLLFIGGLFFVTPDGTFSFSKVGYLRGHPASSGPI